MNGPTWSDVAAAPEKIERRDVQIIGRVYLCPFCSSVVPAPLLKHPAGHRCNCGALFYAQQAVAVHFKERG